jgi:RNA polymerase sigma-70 factor, ECF subfamily
VRSGLAKQAIIAHIETSLVGANPVLERPRLARGEGSPQEQAGDLYERYYDRVFGFCLYKLGDRQEAEDATQTTFLWVIRGLEHGIEPRLEANWLFTIAQNACRARIKTRGRKRERETLSDPQILEQVAPGRVGVQDELLGLEDALRDMPELQRQAIILREWRGFSYREIAAELGLTDAAVETLIFRARRSLASRLENPNVRPAKRVSLAINLGSLLSGAKSFLGLGSAANLTAVAASAAMVAIGLGVQGDTHAGSSSTAQPPTVEATVTASDGKLSKESKKGPKEKRHHKLRSASTHHNLTAPLAQEPEPPAPALPAADGLTATTEGLLARVTDTVDQTGEEVGVVLDNVQRTLEPVTSDLPLLP